MDDPDLHEAQKKFLYAVAVPVVTISIGLFIQSGAICLYVVIAVFLYVLFHTDQQRNLRGPVGTSEDPGGFLRLPTSHTPSTFGYVAQL